MPVNTLFGGQEITFAVEQLADTGGTTLIRALHKDTCAKIASRLGHPEEASKIASLNRVKGIYKVLKQNRVLKVPAYLKAPHHVVNVMSGDDPPTITQGYAKQQVVSRLGQVGIGQWIGSDPIEMQVSVRFEAANKHDGTWVENDIAILEEMAGMPANPTNRGKPPPILRVSTTRNGTVVPLIPLNYQWSPTHASFPLWRISNIEWAKGAGDPWRDGVGRRVRQSATVTLWEWTAIKLETRSVTSRAQKVQKTKPAAPKKKPAKKK